MAFILYLITGIVTAVPVIYALSWAVWGAPILATEYISLLGSVVLVASAFVSLFERRIAARIAFCGVVAIWSFYLPSLVGLARIKLSDQRLALWVVKWTLGSEPLNVSDPIGTSRPSAHLSETDIEQMKKAGVNGSIVTFSFESYGGGSKNSKAILVIQAPVATRVELPEPDATTIIFVQHGGSWQKYPDGAPVLKRTIRIEPFPADPKQSLVMVQLATRARQGFSIWWSKSVERK